MLTIRLSPKGRKHRKHYRIVVAEKQKHVSKKFVDILGFYNPYTKECVVNAEKVKKYLDLNIELSDTAKAILTKQSLIPSKV